MVQNKTLSTHKILTIKYICPIKLTNFDTVVQSGKPIQIERAKPSFN